MQPKQYGIFSLPVIVGALGFFVDIYDLQVFIITRKASFAELGCNGRCYSKYRREYSWLANDWTGDWRDHLGHSGR